MTAKAADEVSVSHSSIGSIPKDEYAAEGGLSSQMLVVFKEEAEEEHEGKPEEPQSGKICVICSEFDKMRRNAPIKQADHRECC